MNHHQLFLVSSGAALAISGTAALAQEIGKVEVHGRSMAPIIRHDVHATCAHVDSDMQDLLPAMVYRSGFEGEVRVSFRLQGGTLSGVRARGLPSLELSNAVRRAMAKVSCINGGEAQDYAFTLRVEQDDGPAPGEFKRTVAVLER